MKRLFSVLFVVCAVCIFPKLSLAAGEQSCDQYCLNSYEYSTDAQLNYCKGYFKSYCTNYCSSEGKDYLGCVLEEVQDTSDYTNNSPVCSCKTSGGGEGDGTTTVICTVSFSPNGAGGQNSATTTNGGLSSIKVTSGTTIDAPDPDGYFLNSGYGFVGWARNSETEGSDDDQISITCTSGNPNVTLYATWSPCNAGTYSDSSTGAYCKLCSPGTYKSNPGPTQCIPVKAGCYGETAGATSDCPSPCKAGTYRSETGGTSQLSCSKVKAGCYGAAGATTNCPAVCSAAGTYSLAGASSCASCSGYTYSTYNASGNTGCTTPTDGVYLVKGGVYCSDGNGCTGVQICPDASDRNYCVSGKLNTCADGNILTGCDNANKGCKGCQVCGAGKYVYEDTVCKKCPAGYYCTGNGKKSACPEGTANANSEASSDSACIAIPAGNYASSCNEGITACVGYTGCGAGKWSAAGATSINACKKIEAGCKGTSAGSACPVPCSAGTYSEEGSASCTACGDGKWSSAKASGCSPISAGCYGTSASSACPDPCPAGEYSNAGSKWCAKCAGGHYLNKCNENNIGCQECKSCPDGTTFADGAVIGKENCGLQTCEYYFNNSDENLEDDWLEKQTDCAAETCYMAPTMKVNNPEEVDTTKPLQPNCCSSPGTLGQCKFLSTQQPCSAPCTGCRTSTGAVCDTDKDEFPDDSYTCPGVRDAGSSSCRPTGGHCYCPIGANLIRCGEYMKNVENVGNENDVCYQDEDGKDRTNYCVDVCYESCNISCTKQCPYMTGVSSCSEGTETHPGRKYKNKNNSQCTYYNDSGTPDTVPNCSGFDFTCAANHYYESGANKCKECSSGYHNPAGNKDRTCKPNVYKVTLNRGDQITNGTSEFFYQYKTNDNCYYYSNYNSTNGIVSGCLDVVDGKQTVQKPTRTGYTFAGYYTEADGKGIQYVDNAGKISEAIYTTLYDKTLYAKWTANTYYAKYSCGEGDGTPNPPEDPATFDQNYTVDATEDRGCKKTWSLFQGWKGTNNGTTIFAEYNKKKTYQWTQADHITFTAQWKPCDACDISSPGSNCTLEVKDNTCTYTTSCKDGYTAVEEYKNTYQPKCTPNVYKVTLDRAGGEDGTSNYFYQYETKGRCYYYTSDDLSTCIGGGEGVQIVNPTRTGYTFNGYYYTEENGEETQYVNENGTTINNIYLTKGDKTLHAKWTAIKYYATYYCNGGVVGDPVLVAFDTKYTVDATSRGCLKPGSLFRGWEGKNNEDTIFAPYKGDTSFFWTQADGIDFTAIWDACPKGYYCKEGLEKKEACPVGSTNAGGAEKIQQCYLAGGQSKICSNIDGVTKCFLLPEGVTVNYSGDWVSPAE